MEPSYAELGAQPLAYLRVRAAVERKGLDASLAGMQCEREISDFQAEPRVIFERMRGKAAKGVVPTEIRVLVVRLRRDIGPCGSREPFYRIMGLQAGLAQPALVNAAKRHPIRTMHDHPTHGSLPFPLSSPIEIDIALMSLIPHRRGRTRRQWARVDLDHAMGDAHAVSDELLGEGRRRATIRQPVLIAVPRAGHTAIDDAPLPDRAILVGAKIGERPDL